MNNSLLIEPALALIILTFIVAMTMMWTRVKAMKAHKVAPQRAEDASKLKGLLPREVMRISDNYNHLHEQPLIFYVLCIFISVANMADHTFAYLAWVYVILRAAHSITQICLGDVMQRFVLFAISWLVLGVMMIRLAFQTF